MEFVRGAPHYVDRCALAHAVDERNPDDYEFNGDGMGWHKVFQYYVDLDGILSLSHALGFALRRESTQRRLVAFAVMYMYGLEAVYTRDVFDNAFYYDVHYHLVPYDVMEFWRELMHERCYRVRNNMLFGIVPTKLVYS